jgi:hypothetical protein
MTAPARKAPVPWTPETTREIDYEERVDLMGPDGQWIRLRLDENGIVALTLKGDWSVVRFGSYTKTDETVLYLGKRTRPKRRRS